MSVEQRKEELQAQIASLQAELHALSKTEGLGIDRLTDGMAGSNKEGTIPYSKEASFFQMLFNSANGAVFLLDRHGQVVSANPGALGFFGVSLEKLKGTQIAKLFKSYKLNPEPLDDVFSNRSTEVTYTSWGIHPDREEVICKIILRRSTNAGEPLFVCICTEKAAVEDMDEILRHSLSRLQRALKNARTFAITIDKHKIITYCNSFLLQITGWDHEELLGQSLLSVFTPFTASQEFVKVQGFLDTFDGTLKTKNGKSLTVRFNSIVMNDQKGGIAAMTIVGEDVTEQLRISQALQETNHLLQEVFDATSDLILIFKKNGRLQYTNNACRQALGYTEEELSNMKIRDLINPNYYEDTYEKLRTAVEQGSYTNFETVFISKKGQKHHLLGDVVCALDENGEPTSLRAILHDHTDQLKAKKSQELYYRLARLVEKDTPLEDLYEQTYLALKDVMPIDSMAIAIQEDPKQPYQVPFSVASPHGPAERVQCRTLVKHGISLKQPMILVSEEIESMVEEEGLMPLEICPKVWLAIPLILKQQTVGVIVVQSFKYPQDHNEKDLDLLSFISGQLTSAIVREQNEAKIHRQAGRLAAIFDSGRHLMWSVNRRGQLTQFNKQFSEAIWEHYRASAEDGIIFRSFYAPHPNPPFHFWMNQYKGVFNGQPKQFTVSFVGENGVERWYEISLNPIMSPSGKVAEVSAVADDITQKKIIELDLSESEEKFRSIFESFQDVYFRTDMEGIINMVSPSVQDLMGETQTQVLGKSVTEYYLSQSKLQYLRNVLLAEGNVKNFESTLIDKTQRSKIIISNFRLIYNAEGQPTFIEGVARDITELKKATEELRKAKNLAEKSLEVKKRFLSNMSHEIRTPMNGIIGMIDLLNDSQLNEEQLQYVGTIKKSSETLLTILNDILDLSKIEAGKMRIREAPMALHRTVDKLKALFTQHAYAKGTALNYEIIGDVPEFIVTDETRLLQILSNLTSNAIKFTENGKVGIKVSLQRFDPKSRKCEIHFAVKDSGIGISRENLDLLFRQFSQVDNSYTKSHGGTGLGLAISQEFSRMMGGQIGVSSSLGRGSTFWFTISAKVCSPEEALIARQQQQPVTLKPLKQPYRLLVVDDNGVNLQVAKGILGKARCKVTVAQSGAQALEIIQSAPPFDMVFMDIQMPQMNGMTATEEMKKILGDNCPPVVAMTAFSMQEEKEEFLGAGMDDFLAKPIKAQALIGIVKRWMEPEEEEEAGFQAQEKAPNEIPEYVQETVLPVLNRETAQQLAQYGGSEILESIYGDFSVETEELLKECWQAFKSDDLESVRKASHTIKGSAGTLGIEQVAAFAKKLEQGLRDKDSRLSAAEAETLIKQMEDAFDKYKNQYLNIIG